MKKRGQVSFEYLIITAFMIMLIIPSIYVLYLYSTKAYSEIGAEKINENGNTILREVESVWYLGHPAKTTLQLVMPAKIKEMSIVKDTAASPNLYELRFVFEENSRMVYNTEFPIKGYYMDENSPAQEKELSASSSNNNEWKFVERQYSEGVKTVIISARKGSPSDGDFVGILIK